jgi:hypothetical protein
MTRFLYFFGWLVAPLLACGAADLPPASDIIARVIKRAELVARETPTNHYVYDKRTITSEMDENGAVTKSTEKLYKVELAGGLPLPRLVKIAGRNLTAKELEKENEREAALRQSVTRVDMKDKAKRKETLVTPDLIEHFDFTVTKREMIEGRPTLVATFKPRLGGAEASIEERIYQKLSGTIWIDEGEAEVAKIDAHLDEPVPVGWFGAVGSLNQFQGTVERTRLPDGVWVNRKTVFTVMARKVFMAVRSKTTAESSGFKRG